MDHGEVAVDLSKNTLVIAGDEAWEVEGLQDVPTIAEPSAPGPYHPVHPAAAHIFRKAQVSANDYVVTCVEQVIVVGHPTLHRSVLALMNDPDIELVVLSRTKDFTNQRGARLGGTTVKVNGEPSREWMKICEGATDMAGQAVRETLEDEELGFTGLHVAAAVGDTLSVNDTLVLGASNPVRDAALVGLPSTAWIRIRRAGRPVLTEPSPRPSAFPWPRNRWIPQIGVPHALWRSWGCHLLA